MIEGGCQCGALRFKVDGEITDLSHCHCSMCRRLHGAAFVTFAGVNSAALEWTTGNKALKTFASSDKNDRLFCETCGSQLGCISKPEPDMIYLAMGTVDGNPRHPPAYHQFVGSVAPWHEINDDLPKHDSWADD
jgi:hypothetical protein